MENILLKIMADSFDQKLAGGKSTETPKPFITISREFGCQANLLSTMLKNELDKSGFTWRIMNKEIIQDAAQKLNLTPEKIDLISGSSSRNQMDEMLHALSSKYYKSDRKIRQTLASVVRSTALSGHVIIVGRGGAAITAGMLPAIHIHLIAPVEWRLNSLLQRFGLKREESFRQLSEFDHKRYKLMRDNLKGMEPSDLLFDLTINCSKVTHQEIVELIMKMVSARKMV